MENTSRKDRFQSVCFRSLSLALLVGGMVTSVFGQVPHSNPNSVKYKNTGAQPATGRSGSASLQVRALIGKNGSTQLEATTGDLEAGTAPGNIDKTQVKVLIGATPAQNFNNLKAGGYWTNTYQGLARKDTIQVQANISGINPPRTDVVTASTPVLFRPDIAVKGVTGPAQAPPHTTVTFTATVQELNGDVGARANCVLSVNGTDVDQANGIWVDAGGTVSCLFTRAFDTPGTYTIGVAATNVNPADWDLANNSASTSITIVQPGQPIQTGYMAAVQYNVTGFSHENNINGSYPVNSDSTWNYNSSYAYLYGNDYQSTPGQGGLQRVDVTLSTNGTPVYSTSLPSIYNYDYDNGDYYTHCGQYYADSWDGAHYVSSGNYAYACSYGSRSGGWSGANYSYERISGDATYYASYYNGAAGYSYTYNYDYTYGSGADLGWNAGTAVRLQVNFVDGTGAGHTADKAVTLQDYTSYWGVNWSYSGYFYDYYSGETIYYTSGQSGRADFGETSW